MLIWLLGKNGQLGRALAFELKKNRCPFLSSGSLEADVTSLESLRNFLKRAGSGKQRPAVTHILNAAAYTDVEKAEKEKTRAMQVNFEALFNLAEIARTLGAKLVHFSTDYVFDGKLSRPYLEDDPALPLNVYGQSKFLGEELIQKLLPEALIIRTSWLFGESENNFVFKILKRMQKEIRLQVVKDQIGRPTAAPDLAFFTLKLLPFSGLFHFAGKEIVCWQQFALQILAEAKKSGLELKTESIDGILSKDFASAAKRPAYSALDLGKTERLLSLKAPSYKIALQKLIGAYAKKN
ncbi:MAG: dTDP-4-dehydrorhamnose reductase [Parachlamydiales bacterium]|jgi:dTDP-4-dehydrorhamnose reductase